MPRPIRRSAGAATAGSTSPCPPRGAGRPRRWPPRSRVPLAAVYSSPLARALDTAGPIAAGRGLEPVTDDRLREIDFGELEGSTYDEIRAARPDVFRAWMEAPTSVRFPGGESFADLRERVLAAMRAVRERHPGEAVAVVA